MSGFNINREDLRKAESAESGKHGGDVPAGSDVSALKSIVDSQSESKQAKIDRTQANLDLPEQPPVASDWNSADARTVNVGVGSGGLASDFSTGDASSTGLREPQSTKDPNFEGVGRQGVEGTKGPPPGI